MAVFDQSIIDIHGISGIPDQIPVGVTVVDLEGRILYYNDYSARIVDRKPEYIGRDIRLCHRKAGSNSKIDRILGDFKSGKTREVQYEAVRGGKHLAVTISPFEVDGVLRGCVQSFIVKR